MNNVIIMETIYIKSLILFTFVIIGGLLALLLRKNFNNNIISNVLTFSGSFLLSITITHLIPDLYTKINSNDNCYGQIILLGFCIQLFLEQFSYGIEHGHLYNTKKIKPIIMLLSLSIHTFFESMPMIYMTNNIVIAIALHHFPASFALSTLFLNNNYKINFVVTSILIFAITGPISMFIGQYLHSHLVCNLLIYNNYVLAITIGMFLYISITILIESSKNHKLNYDKMISIALGISISLI
ncbi:MAG: ZIP family metal transporter [Bacteroides sp.]|nr:MAG: ZIP family metal transporter [Bacteroides sp.]